MRKLYLILSLLVFNAFSFDVNPGIVNFEQIDNVRPGRLIDTSWVLKFCQLDNPYYLTGCYWGITKHNIGNKVAYAVAIYASGRRGGTEITDTIVCTWDSTYQHPDYIWTFDELKAAPSGKVQVALVRSDSIYLIVSDTLKTTIYAYWQVPDGGQWGLDGWNKHVVINQSYSSLEHATVQGNEIVFNYPNSNGWTISNGVLTKSGKTYSSSEIYAIGLPIVDYKNNVWFYGKMATDTVFAKLEAWNGYDIAYTFEDNASGHVKYLMNLSTDIVSGYVGKAHIYKSKFYHPPRYIGPDTMSNASGCPYLTILSKAKVHQDTGYANNNYSISDPTNYSLSILDSTIKITSDFLVECLPEGSTGGPGSCITWYLYSYDHAIYYDSFYVQFINSSTILHIDSLPQRTLTVGDHFIDTIIAYGRVSSQYTTYDQWDSVIQTVDPGRHPDLNKADGQNIYLTSTLPTWLTATKINRQMIVIEGTIPNVSNIDLSISIIDSVIYVQSNMTVFYRTASTPLKITVNQPINNKPIAANDTTISIDQGETYTYTLLATDADNDILTYSYSSTIPVTQNNNVFVLSPSTYGSFIIKLYVTDNKASDSCMITLNVLPTTSIIKSTTIVKTPKILYTAYNVRGQVVSKIYNMKNISLSNGRYIFISNKRIPVTIVK